MDALQLTSAVGPGPGGRRERPTIGLLIGNLKRLVRDGLDAVAGHREHVGQLARGRHDVQ